MKSLISLVILLLFIFTNSENEVCNAISGDDFNDCQKYRILEGKDLCCFAKYTNNKYLCMSYTRDEYANKQDTISKVQGLLDFTCEPGEGQGSNTGGNTNAGGENERERNSNSSKLISLSQTIFILFFLIL